MSLPDPTSITSSTQLFTSTYTLPQIRQIHRSLNEAIEDRSSRLRTQVSAGYRELLDTAETIVRMRDETDQAIDVLNRVGSRCSRSAVGTKVGNLSKLRESQESAANNKLGVAARMLLLEGCSLAAQTHLRAPTNVSNHARHARERPSGKRLVDAAKVLVLGRLLAKSFSDGPSLEPQSKAAVDAAWKSLSSQRRRLFRAVENVLSDSDENLSRAEILKALCAYSLATSGGAKEVVRHFLHVRGEAMVLCFDVSDRERERCSTEDVERCLRLYTRTMVDVQKLVPGKLGGALELLADTTIIEDDELRKVEGLRLDIYEKWCGDEIRYFTPYIRHDDLAGEQAREMLTSWSKKGGQVVLNGLKKTLEQMPEFKSTTQLRSTIMQLWIQEGGKARGFDLSAMLDSLRQVVNSHLLAVLEAKVAKLRLVGSEMSATLDSWKEGETDRTDSLWDVETLDMDMKNGAASLIQEVLSREYGRNVAVSKALACYTSWYHVIDEVSSTVTQLKKTRWESDFGDEIEDEGIIAQRDKLLNKDDPALLENRLQRTLDDAFTELEQTMRGLWEGKQESPNSGPISMYFLRILRDIRSKLPPQVASLEGFGLDMVPSLQDRLVKTVMISPLDEMVTGGLNNSSVMGRVLWEDAGGVELPTWPSPWVFMFLRNMIHSMEAAGIDLWTVTSLRMLKEQLTKQLAQAWTEALEAVLAAAEEEKKRPEDRRAEDKKDEDSENDEEDREDNQEDDDGSSNKEVPLLPKIDPETQRRELLVQWIFDISMIRRCVGPPNGETQDELTALQEAVYERSGLGNEGARKRIVTTSQEYWKKTRLLFGLLEGPQEY